MTQIAEPTLAKPSIRAVGDWQTAVVVGASSGIGEALVKALASQGCRVAAIARRADRLEAVTAEVEKQCGEKRVFPITHDVCNASEVSALLPRVVEMLGGIDLFVYAAGVMPDMEADEYDFNKERAMIDVNLTGAVAWLGAVAQRFNREGAGTIVGISSIAGDRGRRGNPVYGTTKAALNTYLEGLRNRVARNGVSVVTIKPGFIDTPMTEGKPGLLWLISADAAAATILNAAKRKKTNVYVPARWALVGMVIQSIPSRIFRYLNI